jgi:hypothetical protein
LPLSTSLTAANVVTSTMLAASRVPTHSVRSVFAGSMLKHQMSTAPPASTVTASR